MTDAKIETNERSEMEISGVHFVNQSNMKPPFAEHLEKIVFGMGCFWGAEKKFWSIPGVITTAVGYSAGNTVHPTYREVCSGQTMHNEVVLVVFDPAEVSLENLLQTFWQSHNPTQGMRQGNDKGTQYRSGIYAYTEQQLQQAEKSLNTYQAALTDTQLAEITTEILPATEFYYAEEYHQQYLAKNPNGYCGLGGTGVSYDCTAN